MKKSIAAFSFVLMFGFAAALANAPADDSRNDITPRTADSQQAGIAAGLNKTCTDVNGVTYQRIDSGYQSCHIAEMDHSLDQKTTESGQADINEKF